jgi:hypothetical protein
MSFLPTLALNSPNEMFIWYLGNLSNICTNPSHQQFYPLLGHERSTQWSLSTVHYILSLTNSTILTVDVVLLCTEKPVPNSWFSFPFL